MTTEPRKCDAGRTSFFGGKWTEPCPNDFVHEIGSPRKEPIRLCDAHFQEVFQAGLVAEPMIGDAEFERREAERKAGADKRRWPWSR